MFDLWKRLHTAPYHFTVEESAWKLSMFEDVDSDGRKLFSQLHTVTSEHGMIQYGYSAFGFDKNGEISGSIHYPIIRTLAFDPAHPEDGESLLRKALAFFQDDNRIYAFFHYFGMSVCARHGKLHQSNTHVETLLRNHGFVIEHENMYYARTLTGHEDPGKPLTLLWKHKNPGGCREFAAIYMGQEIGWGQIHFLPQKTIAYLRWIYIDSTKQHQGFGTALMHTLCRELFAMGIRHFDTDTALNNAAAQGYYEKTGFQNCGITRSYYTK